MYSGTPRSRRSVCDSELAAEGGDDPPRVHDGGAGDESLLDRLAQRGVRVEAAVPEVAHRGEAALQHLDRGGRALEGAVRRGDLRRVGHHVPQHLVEGAAGAIGHVRAEVGVAIEESRKHGPRRRGR